MTGYTLWKAAVLHFLDDPAADSSQPAFEYFSDGALLVHNGYIVACAEAATLEKDLPEDCEIRDLSGRLLVPGFIDTHVHYPQLEVMAGCGVQLLDWLEQYTFPAEKKFENRAYADEVASLFLQECLSHGTTTALVFATVHPTSVDAFFTEAQKRNMRMISGKVMKDRNAPEYLLDTVQSSYEDSKALIERWHGVDRLSYAVTPRFAPTSTPELLAMAGRLLKEYDGLYLHTHMSENADEIVWVKELFPNNSTYLDVYDKHHLLGQRSVFAHCIHLCNHEWQRLAETDSSVSFCPGSNLFLGSGLFNLSKAQQHGVRTGLGTDVGGGTNLSLLSTMKDAYKVSQLKGNKTTPAQSFYLATLGGARALHLEDRIGSFLPGNEADFVVLDPKATPMLAFRTSKAKTIEELLGVLMVMGDDRVIERTIIMGQEAYRRK